MKKLSIVLLAIIMLFTLSSCNSHAESGKVFKALEEELGSLSEIPVEMDQAIKKLGEGVKQYEPASERDEGQALAISDSTVLYSTVRTSTEREGDTEFKFEIVTLYIGKVKSSSDGETVVTIGAANVKMNVLSEDATGAKEAMLASTNGAPISQKAKSMMKDMIDGKQVTVSAGSNDWEVFCDLDREVTFIVSDGSFKIKKEIELGRLYRDVTEDSEGRPLKEVAYYYDEAGQEYIEEIREYVYNEDESVTINHTYYYSYSKQIKEARVSLRLPMDVEQGGMVTISSKTISSKEYYENGTLKKETYASPYTNDQGYVEKEYNESGTLVSHYEKKNDGTFFHIIDEYYENGNKKTSVKSEGNDKYVRTLWDNIYYENGKPQVIKEYYESGMLKSRYEYYESGDIHELLDYYDGEENNIKQAIYNNGQKDTFFPNGQKQSTTMYFDLEMTRIHRYEEYYENGNMKEAYENNSQGEKIDIRKWYENGTWQYDYGIMDDGTVYESEYYVGDPDSDDMPTKKLHEWEPDGSESIYEWFENGGSKYEYRYYAKSGEKVETFYELVGDESVKVETRTECSDGTYGITKYYLNGKMKYHCYTDESGKLFETYYNEQGYPIS